MAIPFLAGCQTHTHIYDLENPSWSWSGEEVKTCIATYTCSECDETKAGTQLYKEVSSATVYPNLLVNGTSGITFVENSAA